MMGAEVGGAESRTVEVLCCSLKPPPPIRALKEISKVCQQKYREALYVNSLN